MSSGAKRRCALGVHCVIAALRAHDHTCDDWTEIQESDYTQRLTNLLLKVEGAAGETLHLAEDVRVELDYLDALDDGRYRCVVMLRAHQCGTNGPDWVVGANVSPCSVVKRLVVSEGREELTTKATTCC